MWPLADGSSGGSGLALVITAVGSSVAAVLTALGTLLLALRRPKSDKEELDDLLREIQKHKPEGDDG